MKFIEIITLILLLSQVTYAGPREETKFLVDRIIGTQIPSNDFEQLVTLVAAGNSRQAASQLTNHADFFNIQLKNHFTPRSNEERSQLVFLNDYTATLIGMVRDDVPYKDVLSEDILYVGSSSTGVPAYSQTSNRHYQELDEKKIDLSNPANLVRQKQSDQAGSRVPASATAGIITTNQSAKAFFSAGTNRAMFRFLMINYMCRDMEALHDVSAPSERIRKDISRGETFNAECIGCHTGMDAKSGAFAYFDYDLENGGILYDSSKAQSKYNNGANVFPGGFETVDDSWKNYWRVGQNSSLGFSAAPPAGVTINPKFKYSSGNGAKSLGRELAGTKAFSACAVKQVFEKVCNKKAANLTSQDKIKVEQIASTFETSNYNYKEIWVESALYCMP